MKIGELFVSKKTRDHIKQLYRRGEADRKIRMLRKEKSLLFAVIVALSVIIAVPLFVADSMEAAQPLFSVKRNGYGKGAKTVTVRAVTEDGNEEKISIDVAERRYTEEELQMLSQKMDEQLWTEMLGENTDAGDIEHDLAFPKKIEGYPFDISWKSDRPLILSSSGVINTEKLSDEDTDGAGVKVKIRATLKYMDHTEDRYSYVVLRQRTDGSRPLKDTISEAVKESDRKSGAAEEQVLPEYAGGKRISFYRTYSGRGAAVLFTGIVIAFLVMSVMDGRIKNEAENRRKQMEADHPRILNQYMLYYLAGMNPRAIWSAICKRYEDDSGRRKEKRYAYEEMITTRHRMDEGCGELAAYDEFAARCNSVKYRSFVSFVKQAVVKGNNALEDLLYEEMEKAQRDRNNYIRMRSSEAETKLLLPMFMMLTVVLVIVMVPALLALN